MTNPKTLVIDTDPGVDDALALVLALRSPEFRVELVTTVAGNVPIEAVTDNARRLLALLGGEATPRLARGAARPLSGRPASAAHVHGEDGLAGLSMLRDARGAAMFPASTGPRAERNAASALIEMARKHEADLTLVALGPLTNLAHALEKDPQAMRRIGRVIVMGGAIAVPGNITPGAEFNFFADPLAADRVLSAGLNLTLVPLDVTRQVRLHWPSVRKTLAGRHDRLARALRHVAREMASRSEGMVLHDPLAMALALEPGLVTTRALSVVVDSGHSHARGMSVADRRSTPRSTPGGPPVDVAMGIDADRALALITDGVLTRVGTVATRRLPTADVIVVGSANIDLTVAGVALPRPGETVTGGVQRTGFGGKGANQAVAAQHAGAEVILAARLGDDAHGDQYLAQLHAESMNTIAVSRDRRAPTGVALIAVDSKGHNQITVAPGANARLRPAHLLLALRRLRAGSVLVAQLEVPIDTVEAAFHAARRKGALTLLNPAPYRALPTSLVALTDVVVTNERETEQLLGHPVSSTAAARRAAATLVSQGFGAALVTLGARGVVWHDGGRGGYVPSKAVDVVDTTGAGDVFVGCLAAGLARGDGIEASIPPAVAAAARGVSRAGAR